MASLTSEKGAHPFWVPISSPGAELRLLIYSGCYFVAALPSDFPHYPALSGAQDEVRVGRICTCDAAAPMQ